MSEEKKGQPKPAVMYVNEIKDGKYAGQKKLNLILNLEALGVGKGEIKLTGFQNEYKKTPQHPDFNFRFPAQRPSGAKQVADSGGSYPVL